MATNKIVPKQWNLRTNETLNSFIVWRDNLIYTLSLNEDFACFIVPGVVWTQQSFDEDPHRGQLDDDETVTVNKRTKQMKCIHLNLLLGQIANFCTVISRNQIIKDSTCLNDVWGFIRSHYGFQETGSRFLDLSNIHLEPDERYEALYQRILSFFDDNLMTTSSTLSHHGKGVARDEQRFPTIENTIVLTWLERIHSGLPGLVKQRYGSELRNKTLASLKPEISSALDSLVAELRASEGTHVLRMQMSRPSSSNYRRDNTSSTSYKKESSTSYNNRSCCLCRAAGRQYNTHYLSQCRFLPESDRKRMNPRIRFVDTEVEEEDNACESDGDATCDNELFVDAPTPATLHRRVSTRKSPMINCYYKQFPARMCIDSGAESSLVSERFARYTNMKVERTRQGALQADSRTPLNIIGESSFNVKYGHHIFKIEALVTREDIGDIIAGGPCLEQNDIAIRPSKRQIILKGRDIVPYSNL